MAAECRHYGTKSEDGHPLGQGSDKILESWRARDTTINKESMTAAWGEKIRHQKSENSSEQYS